MVQLNDQMRYFVRHNLANKKSQMSLNDLRSRLVSRWQYVKNHKSPTYLAGPHCSTREYKPGLYKKRKKKFPD